MRSLTALRLVVPLVVVASGALLSCATGDTGTSGGTESGAGGATSGAGNGTNTGSGGAGPCTVGDTKACYTGPPATEGLGQCVDGTASCETGTWGPCVGDVLPGTEACDGLDNNCDGMIDDGCSCDDGATQPCYGGPPSTKNVGPCVEGIQSCANGAWSQACVGQVVPQPESCDSTDEDCDGTPDNGNPGGGASCDSGQPGACAAGTQTCVGGALQCEPNTAPTGETCNLADDDCDGAVDNGNPGGGGGCSTGQPGVCGAGTQTCQGGNIVCVQNTQPSGEVCNALDDNCNGSADEGNPGSGQGCGVPGKAGVCASGLTNCSGGSIVCSQVNFPAGEVCDGLDNDCNGLADENCVCGCCPYVYAFDGEGFAYETSVGGAGLWGNADHLERGKEIAFAPLWVRLDKAMVARDGAGRGSVAAEILAAEDEIVYLDAARLTVVEHPAGHEVLSSSSAHWPTARAPDPRRFYALRTAALRAPRSATWNDRVDVTRAIAEKTDIAVAHDVTTENVYELDFGDVADAGRALLVIDGWKYKKTRRLRKGTAHVRPFIEVEQADGSFARAMHVAPPRGDRKAVVINLSKVEWPSGRYRMRLSTGTHERGNAMWYVDRVRLTEEAPAEVRVTEVLASRAELGFSGAPTIHDESDHTRPRWNTDDGGGALSPEQRTYGRFTRYGDVRELVAEPDDRLVVMRKGDGLTLGFDGIGEAAPGFEQALFLCAELVFKPRVNAAVREATTFTESVDPLPFHGMQRYPYGPEQRFPDGERHLRWLAEYQTREHLPGDVRWGHGVLRGGGDRSRAHKPARRGRRSAA